MHKKLYFLLLISTFIFSQDGSVLPMQKIAINTIKNDKEISNDKFSAILASYGVSSLEQLSQSNASKLIKSLQREQLNERSDQYSENIAPVIAETLEIGMTKRFYLIDGNSFYGTITEVDEQDCTIKTENSMAMKIPLTDILEERIEVTLRNGDLVSGPVISENEELMEIKTKYNRTKGNYYNVWKKDIENMTRFNGGKKVKNVNKKKFYQGEAQLIGVFQDPLAFSLTSNTFFISGLSLGYGFTERFQILTKFGSNFSGDLNLHPHMRFFHKKDSKSESALAWGMGFHRAYPYKKIAAEYAHFIKFDGNKQNCFEENPYESCDGYNTIDKPIAINEIPNFSNIEEVFSGTNHENTSVFASAYLVYSSRRANPSGRGKVGWSVGLETNSLFLIQDDLEASLNNYGSCPESAINNDCGKYTIENFFPYRIWANFEYDLQKNLKFVAAMWADNGNRFMKTGDVLEDYFGDEGDPFVFDSPKGEYNPIDFDFGFMYAVNNNFRIGLHFQKPYLDFYWEFND